MTNLPTHKRVESGLLVVPEGFWRCTLVKAGMGVIRKYVHMGSSLQIGRV